MNEKETVQKIIIKVIEEMCNSYCKYPELIRNKYKDKDPDEAEDLLYDECCENCPLNLLC